MIQKYKLNMLPHAERTYRGYIPPKVNVSQYDKGLRTLVFDLYDGNQAYALPENATAKIYGKKPDQNVFEYDMTIDASGEVPAVSIDLQEQMAVIAGMVECEVRIFSGSQTAGTANFLICVEPAPVGAEEAYSESEIPEIDNLLYGGTAGQVFTKTPTGAHWADLGTSSDFMRKSEYDPNDDGSVLKADHADDADTVDGHTVARNVLADEYTNSQIDTAVQAVSDAVSQLDGEVVKKVNNVAPVAGNVALAKADIGLGNVDNTSDANKPISTATQAALDLKVDKEAGKGLSTNDFTTAEKEKLAGIAAGAEVNVQANWNETDQTADSFIQNKPSIPSKTSDLTNDSGFVTDASMQSALEQKVDKVAGKGLSTEDFTSAEKTKLAGIEAGAQVNTVLGVKGGDESVYRTGNVNITKTNIGLGNVDNTSDMDKPISTATQTALDGKQATLTFDSTPTAGSNNPVTSGGIATEISALNTNLSSKVSSVNGETPDTNGNVQIDATHIDTSSGVAIKSVSGNPVTIADALQGKVLGVNTTLEPIQDLHGYDHPWVGGASGNLLAATPYSGSYANAVGGDLKINAPMDISFSSDMIKVLVNVTQNWRGRLFATKQLSAGDYYCSAWILTTTSGNDNARVSIYVTDADLVVQSVVANQSYNGTQAARVVTVTEGQRIAVFVGSVQIDTVSVDTFQVNAGSTPTTYFPFENICPISGRTAVNVTRTGKNLFDQNILTTWTQRGRNIFTITDGIVTVKEQDSTSETTETQFFSLPKGTFTFSISNVARLQIAWGGLKRADVSNTTSLTFTLNESRDDLHIKIIASSYPFTAGHIQIESGLTATAYDPYQGQSVTVQLGQTVYGGALNVSTGELVSTYANIASYNGETIREPWLSSMDEYVAGATPTTGAQVVYPLATPTESSVTPAQLNLLSSTNILTTNADDLSIRYYATGQTGNVEGNLAFLLDKTASNETAINSLAGSLAMVETSPAKANHAVDDYLMLNNRLCKVTAVINTGESIIVGTNVSYTTVADELKAILAQISA